MRVDDALGVARSCRTCSTWPQALFSSSSGQAKLGRRVGQERLVVQHLAGAQPAGVAVAHHDHVFHGGELRRDPREHRQQRRVDETTRSSAWLAIHATWSGCSRMFSVCSTEPMHGTREVQLLVPPRC